MSPVPILFYSDAVAASSGLARITRDLCLRVNKYLPGLFRVASIGYGSSGSSRLGFPQYHWQFRDDFVIPDLPEIWRDFANGKPGVLFTVHDASRMLWLVHPEQILDMHNRQDARISQFVRMPPFHRVGYFPIDAAGIDGRFTHCLKQTYAGYDRVLAYTKWAEGLLRDTLDPQDVVRTGLTYLPHGVDTSVFYPRDRREARAKFFQHVGINHQLSLSDKLVIGIVATNQPRKDFGLAFAALREVAKTRDVVIWIKTDLLERHWSIPGLAQDFKLKAFVTLDEMTDEAMANAYSACDVTVCCGLSEGWGMPLHESLACGCPVVGGNHGGATEFVPARMLVDQVTTRIESPYSVIRPVYDPKAWAEKIIEVADRSESRVSLAPVRYNWDVLWKAEWEPYFEKLHKDFGEKAVGA